MLNTLNQFLNMGGYGFYVWGSYGSVIAFLVIQWLLPWRRWRTFLRKQSQTHE